MSYLATSYNTNTINTTIPTTTTTTTTTYNLHLHKYPTTSYFLSTLTIILHTSDTNFIWDIYSLGFSHISEVALILILILIYIYIYIYHTSYIIYGSSSSYNIYMLLLVWIYTNL